MIGNHAKNQLEKRVDALESRGAGGGVGEWMDSAHTAERFNDYRDFDTDTQTGGNYSGMRYDHVEGYGNKVIPLSYQIYDGYNHVEGQNNTLTYSGYTNCWNDHAEGYGNTLNGSNSCHVEGNLNTLNTGTYNHVEGYSNTVSGGYALHVGGNQNTVTNGSNHFVYGQSNTVTNTGNSTMVVGEQNSVVGTVSDSIIVGYGNEVHNSRCAVFGHDNYCNSQDALVFGRNANTGNSDRYILVGGSGSNVITLTTFGDLWTAGSSNSSGADYAEYFEWADGNPDGDDRCGMLVDLDGDKIVPAHGDDILGIVSGKPSVIGNSYEDHWQGKFKHDVFGRIIRGDNGEAVLSENYDSTAEYIPRSERKEWAAVGMTGRLVIVDDGSCKVGGFVSARHGIGSAADNNTGVRVLKRIDQTHVEVVIK